MLNVLNALSILLICSSEISKSSESGLSQEKEPYELYGKPCQGPDGRTKAYNGTYYYNRTYDDYRPYDYCYEKGLVDSEFACIAFLENKENKPYIANFINDEIKDDKVTKISLHGFTTRDTCLACLPHLTSYRDNANREFCNKDCFKIECKEIVSKNKETFWKKLKNTLGKKVENLSGPVDFYISSRIYFDGSSKLVKPMVDAKNNENNPMKMLVLRKEFDKKYPKCIYNSREWPSKFSNFMKNNTEDLDENFCSYLNEPKRRCLNKIISAVKSETPGVIDISDQINK